MPLQYAFSFLTAISADRRSNSAALYLLLLLAWPVANALLHTLPSGLGLAMTKTYFLYFFAGFVFHIIRPNGLPTIFRWIPYLMFVAFVPFWYRTETSPLALLFSNSGFADQEYQRIVAFAGTLAFIDSARLFADKAPVLLTQAVAYAGKRSLDVYAIHFYFLGYFPPVIAPIGLSLGVSLMLRTNRLTSWLCFGQKTVKFLADNSRAIAQKRTGTHRSSGQGRDDIGGIISGSVE
jgi:hypothetical protein